MATFNRLDKTKSPGRGRGSISRPRVVMMRIRVSDTVTPVPVQVVGANNGKAQVHGQPTAGGATATTAPDPRPPAQTSQRTGRSTPDPGRGRGGEY